MLQRVVGVRRRVGGGAAGAVRFAASCPPQLPPDALLRVRIEMLTAGGLDDILPLVAPGVEVVVPVLTVQAREHSVQVLGVRVVLGQDRGRVRVGQDVVLEVLAAAEHVVDQPADERDVRSGPDRQV
jgi:hypothetical protein